ncbi:hypothetical protein [Nannocystis sp. SCPEA4]|uniref:hypothetical protein n=1 Tax=Nannocystis sp. SCPEA4 TaxID=2996787 RepID=UPI00227158F5|nr:hypothetical protein [Nannocystis sp. SCPEA4]MCY1058064.1 hypothetical protein [Nannocystis sp. SCPEA4]
MKHGALLLCLGLASAGACGPEPPEGSDSDAGSSSTSEAMTSGGAPTTTVPGPTPTTNPDPTADPTTGEPVTCPEGQPWELLGAAELAVPAGFVASARRRVLAVTEAGQVAIAGALGEAAAPAVLLASPAGEVQAVNAGAPGPEAEVLGLQRGPEGDLVLLGARVQNDKRVPFFARFAADGAPLSEVPLELPVLGQVFALTPDGGIVAGLDQATDQRVLANFAVDTGALLWNHTLGGADELVEDAILVGSQGPMVLVTRRDVDDQGVSNRLDVDVRDQDGAVLSSTVLEDLPYSFTSAIALTPDKQIVVLRTLDPEFVDLIALDLADGLPVWFQTVAEADPTGRPTARDLIVDADALTIPVLRTGADEVSLGSVAIQRVAFDGELLETVPLPVPANPAPHSSVLATRGECGELVLLAGEEHPLWLGSFAP